MLTEYVLIGVGVYLSFGLVTAIRNSLWMTLNISGGVTAQEFFNAFYIVLMCWPIFINHQFYMEFDDDDD